MKINYKKSIFTVALFIAIGIQGCSQQQIVRGVVSTAKLPVKAAGAAAGATGRVVGGAVGGAVGGNIGRRVGRAVGTRAAKAAVPKL